MAVGQNLVPLVNIKIAGKWMFIPLKMVLIGIDPYPNLNLVDSGGEVPCLDPVGLASYCWSHLHGLLLKKLMCGEISIRSCYPEPLLRGKSNAGKTMEVRDFPRYRRVTSTLKVAHVFQWKVMTSNRPTPWQLERLAPHRFAPCPPDPPNAPFASKKEGNPRQKWHFHGKKLWARLEKNIGKSWKIKNILRKLGRFQMLNVQLHRQIADFPMRNARCPSNLPNPNCFKGSKCEGLDYPVVCGSQTMHINCSFSDVRHLALSTQQSDPSWVCIAH